MMFTMDVKPPRDGTKILAYCLHNADPYFDGSRLTDYATWAEGESHAPDGFHIIAYGGGHEEDESGEGWGPITRMPDWWFTIDPLYDEFKHPANPVLWMHLPDVSNQILNIKVYTDDGEDDGATVIS